METMGVTPTMPMYAGSGDMFGGSWGLIILVLLFLGGGFGFGGNRQTATTDELSAGFNFAGINNKLNELTAGQANINQNLGNAICQSTYELASKIDNCLNKFLSAIKTKFTKINAVGSFA